MSADLKYWIGFNKVPGIGPKRFAGLLKYFGSASLAWAGTVDELRAAGLDKRSLESLIGIRSELALDSELEQLERASISAITVQDPTYPPLLKQIYDPPYVLYVRGKILSADEWAIAVVGTRKASAYGREAGRRLAADLATNNISVVSGLAQGIDSYAHKKKCQFQS